MECYSAIKMNEVLMHAMTWTNLRNIVLSERSQARKGLRILFYDEIQNRLIHKDGKEIGSPRKEVSVNEK